MKKFINISTLAALLIVGAVFTACSSDSNDVVEPKPVNPTGPKTYTLTINAAKEAKAMTRALDLTGSTLTPSWKTTETIYVYKSDNTLIGTLHPQTDGVTAVLSGTLTTIEGISVGNTLTLKYGRETIEYTSPNAASVTCQAGTIENIADNYDYATATATVTAVTASGITADNGSGGNVIFNSDQAVVKFTLVKTDGETAINATSLTISDNGASLAKRVAVDGTVTKGDVIIKPASATNVLYAALRNVGTNLTLTAIGSDGKYYSYEKSSGSAIFDNGKYKEVKVKMQEIVFCTFAPNGESVPTPSVDGLFTLTGNSSSQRGWTSDYAFCYDNYGLETATTFGFKLGSGQTITFTPTQNYKLTVIMNNDNGTLKLNSSNWLNTAANTSDGYIETVSQNVTSGTYYIISRRGGNVIVMAIKLVPTT